MVDEFEEASVSPIRGQRRRLRLGGGFSPVVTSIIHNQFTKRNIELGNSS